MPGIAGAAFRASELDREHPLVRIEGDAEVASLHQAVLCPDLAVLITLEGRRDASPSETRSSRAPPIEKGPHGHSAIGMAAGRFRWCVVYAAQLHLLIGLVFSPSRRGGYEPSLEPAPELTSIETEPAEPPVEQVDKEADHPVERVAKGAGTARKPSPQHRVQKGNGTPAGASSVVAAPAPAFAIPVASQPFYPGGLTSSASTSEEVAHELFGEGATDLSRPARLGGRKNWGCTVRGAPAMSRANVRVLVGKDGRALRVEVLRDDTVSQAIMEGATPCAMAEHYISGTDRDGRPTTKWTLPFHIVVTGDL